MRTIWHSTCVPVSAAIVVALSFAPVTLNGQSVLPRPNAPAGAEAANTGASPATPADFVIGLGDVLSISVWRDKDLSVDAVVRPDGKVSLQLVNDIQAAGLTPEQFRQSVTKAITTSAIASLAKNTLKLASISKGRI